MTMHLVCACILCLLYASHTQSYTKYEAKPAVTSSIATTNPVYPDPNRPELIKSYLAHRRTRSTNNKLPSEQFFIEKVFEKFSEKGDILTLNDFEKLLQTIGLENVIFKNSSNNKNHSSNLNNNFPTNSLVGMYNLFFLLFFLNILSTSNRFFALFYLLYKKQIIKNKKIIY